MALLDAFKNKPTRQLVEKLYSLACDCRTTWYKNLTFGRDDPLENCIKGFQKIARIYNIDQNLIEKEVAYMRESWSFHTIECKYK